MSALVSFVVFEIVRAARRGCRADVGVGKSGASGAMSSYALVIVRSCLRRSRGSDDGVVEIGFEILLRSYIQSANCFTTCSCFNHCIHLLFYVKLQPF